MPVKDTPSETSPLLSKSSSTDDADTIRGVEASVGITPEGPDAGQTQRADGSSLERQSSNEGRLKQYEGMPEVKKRMKYTFPALSIGVFLAAADQTLIVSSYGKIGTDLDALNKTSWIATAYFLTLTSFQPLYGKLSDIFGRKPCLLFAYVVFGLGCLGCGLARNITELVAARAVAGIGGGGMTTVVSILLSDAIPLKERGTWQGYINIVFASGGATGAPLGGILADSIGWRWSFTFQAPACLIAFITVAIMLKLPPVEEANMKQKFKRIDFLGSGVLICAIFSLLYALDRGSNLAWKDAVTLEALAVAVALVGLFILVELKVSTEPIAPGRIIFQRSMIACFLCNFFSFAGWMAALFYMSLYYQGYYGFSSTRAGVLLIPNIVAGVSGSLFGGYYMRKTGKFYRITLTCYGFLVIGLIIITCCAGLIIHSVLGTIFGAVICGFSNGIGVTTTLIGLIANAKRDDQAVATACSYLFRSLGSTCGVSLSATAFNTTLREALKAELGSGKAAEKITQAVRRSLESIRELPPELQQTVRRSYGLGTRSAFLLEVAFVFGAACSAWFIREKPLS